MPLLLLRDLELSGTPLRIWSIAAIVFVATFGALAIIRALAARRLAPLAGRTATRLDDIALDLLQRTRYSFLLLLAVYAASLVLALPADSTPAVLIRTVTVIALLVQGALWGNALIGLWVRQWGERRAVDAETRMTMTALTYAARIALWALVTLLILDNLGVNITALVTGLGIGGVAVALAVQNILGDLFAALSIVLDKPFVVGDTIDLGGDFVGTVQHIGLKSTRIRSISGEMIVISNGDLLKSRIRNYRGQRERRVLFRLVLDPATSPEALARVPVLLRAVIEAQPSTRFDRSHVKAISDVGYEVETVYYMTDPDYVRYMDTQQAINLETVRRFAAEGIGFARALRTVVVVERDLRRGEGGRTVPPVLEGAGAGEHEDGPNGSVAARPVP